MNGIKWTNAQVSVTQSAPEARLLVDAGPGTGKTATACARVAWLIEEAGIEPHQILMTSFTNTAVYEIRNRIRSYLRDPDLSAGIRISTLDSFAWNLRAGFHDGEIGFSSYDENS
jgi:superfamily I DNA/RNA helicase